MKKIVSGLADTGNLILGANVADTLPGYDVVHEATASLMSSPGSANATSTTIVSLLSMMLIKVAGNLVDRWIEKSRERKAKRKARKAEKEA
jgi:uncharacterized protein (DUF2062 family)